MHASLMSGALVLKHSMIAVESESLPAPEREYRILIADDDNESLQIYRLFFEHQGMRVFTTDEVDTALHLARLRWPDIILCEWTLSQRDSGRLLLDMLLESQETCYIPRLVVTTRLLPFEQVDNVRGKCADLMSKPVALRTLGHAIEEILGSNVWSRRTRRA